MSDIFDIIPDIHGRADKLKGALHNLGYAERQGTWRHENLNRRIVFLGDFIDRGPDNLEVIDIVRRIIDAGTGFAVMGNHELNAIHYFTNGEDGPLREHTQKNQSQHETFLAEFELGSTGAREMIEWMQTLPLFLEFANFRAVHACWDEATIENLKKVSSQGVLSEEQTHRVADKSDPLNKLVGNTLKGPKVKLPEGTYFIDDDGFKRQAIRTKWWSRSELTWREFAISVPNLDQLPDSVVPAEIMASAYPTDAPPVFFGHYWLEGTPTLQSHNTLCLDYSAGRTGPLVSYSVQPDMKQLSLDSVTVHH